MEAKSYGMQFLFFEKLISHWSRLRFLLAVHPCDHAVDSFPKWYDTWKSAQKWGRESHFFNLVTFLTNTKKFKNPWLGAPGPFFGLFQWCQGTFLKVPEGFQRKKFSSCADTLLLPIMSFRGIRQTTHGGKMLRWMSIWKITMCIFILTSDKYGVWS